MGALFHRERTGEATVVDVSLLGTGLWAMGQAVALSLVLDMPWAPPADRDRAPTRSSRTYDDRRTAACSSFTCLQAGKYWPPLCEVDRPARAGHRRALRRPRVAHGQQRRRRRHPRPRSSPSRRSTSGASGSRPSSASGPSSRTRSRRRPTRRPSPTATCRTAQTADGHAVPAGRRAGAVRRARPRAARARPEFNEHGDAILAELGLDWDTDRRPQGPRRRRLTTPHPPPRTTPQEN